MIRNAICFIVLITVLLYGCNSEPQKSGNPVLPGKYADPECALFGDTYWIFPTRSVAYEEGIAFDAFSSKDLISWTKYENILDSSIVKWVREALWAPAIVEKNGKYYLFFSANDIQHPGSQWWRPEDAFKSQYGGIGIAVADAPQGPYKDYLGKPHISEFYNNAQPIDQFIFHDLDGKYYIIYGGLKHCNIGQLNDDFTQLVPFTDGSIVKKITPNGYVEGSVMFYRNNKLYFMWSEGAWTNSTYQVAYSIANSPFGPFNRIGEVFERDSTTATGAGHHSVLNIPGTDDWYIFYHRRPVPNENRYDRVTCIERMYFNSDGTIKPVKMTKAGVEKRIVR